MALIQVSVIGRSFYQQPEEARGSLESSDGKLFPSPGGMMRYDHKRNSEV